MLQGTQDEISRYVESVAKGTGNLMRDIIRTIDNNRSLLTEDDLFNKVMSSRTGSQLVIPQANFYINLSKGTFVVAGLIASLTSGDQISALIDLFEALFNRPFDMWAKLKTEEGQTCILLEAARERKKGITRKHFPKECFNNHLECGARCDGECCLKEEYLDNAVDDNLLIKRRGRYYYKDWL